MHFTFPKLTSSAKWPLARSAVFFAWVAVCINLAICFWLAWQIINEAWRGNFADPGASLPAPALVKMDVYQSLLQRAENSAKLEPKVLDTPNPFSAPVPKTAE